MDEYLRMPNKITQASITLKAETAGRSAWPSKSPWPVGA